MCFVKRDCLAATDRNDYAIQVERKDWFKVAKGAMSLAFWRGQLTTHPSYSWYLQRVRTTVQHALATSEASQVVLVGHSAGGWLARAFTGASRIHSHANSIVAATALELLFSHWSAKLRVGLENF
jgi:alpha-beta hydrolase superfamily lysophospholipase